MRGEAELFAHLSRLPARSSGAEFSFYRARTFMTLELCTGMAARCATQLALGPSGGPGRSLAGTMRPDLGAGAGVGGGRGADSVGFGLKSASFCRFWPTTQVVLAMVFS